MKVDTLVRVYITEGSHLLSPILTYLKKTIKVRGVSVFRAIQGFGDHGEHSATLIDLSLNLPLVVEFFDHPDKVKEALEELNKMIKPEHIVSWQVQVNES